MGLFSDVFGSGSETKSKSSAKYSNQTGPLLGSQGRLQNNIFNLAQSLYDQTPKDVYGGDLVAPMSGATGRSLGMLSNLAGQDFGGGQIGDFASQLLSGQFLDPNSNPYFKATVDAATRPILQNLREQQLPALTSQAVQSGAYGGTRNAVAQGLASGRASQAVGDTSANLSNQIYEAERARQMQAPQMFAQAAGLKTLPAQLMGQVGTTLENYQNQQLGQDYQRYLMKQNAPWIGFQNLMAPAFQNAGQKSSGTQSSQSQTSTVSTPSIASVIGQAMQGSIGGGMMGAQGAQQGSGAPWAAPNAWTPPNTGMASGIGSILGGLSGLFGARAI
jgi:hypothetical protein